MENSVVNVQNPRDWLDDNGVRLGKTGWWGSQFCHIIHTPTGIAGWRDKREKLKQPYEKQRNQKETKEGGFRKK